MRVAENRHSPAPAPGVFVAMEQWEEFVPWLFRHTQRWPRTLRATLTQRMENLALQVLDDLVQVRYDKKRRLTLLKAIDLRLERMRHLLRVAVALQACPKETRHKAVRRLDETGRRLGAWRKQLVPTTARPLTAEEPA